VSQEGQEVYLNLSLGRLAKDIFWAIICRFRSLDLPEVATTLSLDIRNHHRPLEAGEAELPSLSLPQGPTADIMAQMIDLPHHPDVLGWVSNAVMQKGCLWCGRRATDDFTANTPTSSVFDCDDFGYIITPAADSVVAPRPTSNSRRMPISWLVDRPRKKLDGCEVLNGRDLVRGVWKDDEAS